ncbi:hypothetical protein ACFWJM_28780 [Streptomyces sp. NPDC127077]|uniref:hypothetical protein n=1 Tax=Streptomyces sp. NPDC127077 TaxID=3347131 RepID=UPI003653C47A
MPPKKKTRERDMEAQNASGSDNEGSNASATSVTDVPFVAATINGQGEPSVLPITAPAPPNMTELPEPIHPEREHGIYFQDGDLVPPQFVAQGMSGQIYNYSQAAGAWLKTKAEPILSFAAKALPLATQVASTYTEGATSANLQKASTYLAAVEAVGNMGHAAYKAYSDPGTNRLGAATSVAGSLASVAGTVMSAKAAEPERTREQLQRLTTLGAAFTAAGGLTSFTHRPTQQNFLPYTESPATSADVSARQGNSDTSLSADTYAMNPLPTSGSPALTSVASLRSPGAVTSSTSAVATPSAVPVPPPKAVTKRNGQSM